MGQRDPARRLGARVGDDWTHPESEGGWTSVVVPLTEKPFTEEDPVGKGWEGAGPETQRGP